VPAVPPAAHLYRGPPASARRWRGPPYSRGWLDQRGHRSCQTVMP
jgi:hypothetical protein